MDPREEMKRLFPWAKTCYSTVDKEQLNDWIEVLIDKDIDFMIVTRDSIPHGQKCYHVLTNANEALGKILVDRYGFDKPWII